MEIPVSSTLNLDVQSVMTGRGCVIGQSGSGKSYLIGLIAEELARLKMPFIILDTEGEYSSFKDSFEVMWVGGHGADIGLDVDYKAMLLQSMNSGIPIVFDVSEEIDKQARVYKVLKALYELEEKEHNAYLVIIEEADKFAPQVTHQTINAIEEISVRGRKRGIGLLVATQRPASISKNVLAQCSYGFIGKLTIENDLGAVGVLFEDRKKLAEIPSLSTGEFLPFGINHDDKIKVRSRQVRHLGSTPRIRETPAPNISASELIRELKAGEIRHERPMISKISQKRMRVETIRENITQEEVRRFAEAQPRKMFLLFGNKIENIDEIKRQFKKLLLARLRVPTGKKAEYREGYLILDNRLNLARSKIGFAFYKSPVRKPIKLNEEQLKMLSIINARPGSTLGLISKLTGSDFNLIERNLNRFEDSGILIRTKDRYKLANNIGYLSESPPNLVTKDIAQEQDETRKEKARNQQAARLLIENLFPNSILLELSEIYMPFYQITIRNKEKVRVFNLDAIFGKPIEDTAK